MIEGKIEENSRKIEGNIEDSRQTCNIKVVFEDSSRGTGFTLEDEDGEFLAVQPDVQRDTDLPDPHSGDVKWGENKLADDDQEVMQLHQDLEEAARENASLRWCPNSCVNGF